jgi:hypothetical protein
LQFGQRLGDGIKQADAVLRFDLDECACF